MSLIKNTLPLDPAEILEVGYTKIFVRHRTPVDTDITGRAFWVKPEGSANSTAALTTYPYAGEDNFLRSGLIANTSYDFATALYDEFFEGDTALLDAQFKETNTLLNISEQLNVTTNTPTTITNVEYINTDQGQIGSPTSTAEITLSNGFATNVVIQIENQNDIGTWITVYSGERFDIIHASVDAGDYKFRVIPSITFTDGNVDTGTTFTYATVVTIGGSLAAPSNPTGVTLQGIKFIKDGNTSYGMDVSWAWSLGSGGLRQNTTVEYIEYEGASPQSADWSSSVMEVAIGEHNRYIGVPYRKHLAVRLQVQGWNLNASDYVYAQVFISSLGSDSGEDNYQTPIDADTIPAGTNIHIDSQYIKAYKDWSGITGVNTFTLDAATGNVTIGSTGNPDYSNQVPFSFNAATGILSVHGGVVTDQIVSADYVMGNIAGQTPKLHTAGKPNYSSTAAGIWMGWDSTAYKFRVGDSLAYIDWDGTNLNISGDVNIDGNAIATGTLQGDSLEVGTTITAPEILGGRLVIGTPGVTKTVTLDSDATASPIVVNDGTEDVLRFVTINEGSMDERTVLKLSGGLAEKTITSLDVFSPEVLSVLAPPVTGSTGGYVADTTLPFYLHNVTSNLYNHSNVISEANDDAVQISIKSNTEVETSTGTAFKDLQVIVARSLNSGTFVEIYNQVHEGTVETTTNGEITEHTRTISLDIEFFDDAHGANPGGVDSLEYNTQISWVGTGNGDIDITANSVSQSLTGGGIEGVASSATFPYIGLSTAGNTTYPTMEVINNPASSGSWLRTPFTGLLPYSQGASSLGTSSWPFAAAYSNTFYEGGSALNTKYLGITATANHALSADTATYATTAGSVSYADNAGLLDNLDSTAFGRLASASTWTATQTFNTIGFTSAFSANATQLVLNAGESHSYATGQTGEVIYMNAEDGVQINVSPDNWGSGWGGRNTITLNTNSIFPGNVTAPTFIGSLTGNASSATNATNLGGRSSSEYSNVARSEGGMVYVGNPSGGQYASTSSTVIGPIAIKLPTQVFNSSDMITFDVAIFDYATNESVWLKIAGYVYANASNRWVNQTAVVLSNNNSKQYKVRFGNDGTRHVVYIGEDNSSWNYPQVKVTNLAAGYSPVTVASWYDGWDITITNATAPENVEETLTATFPVAKEIVGFDHTNVGLLDANNSWTGSNTFTQPIVANEFRVGATGDKFRVQSTGEVYALGNIVTSGNVSADSFNTVAADDMGLKFWNGSSLYKIVMSSSASVTEVLESFSGDYNIYFKMSGGTNRGWVFYNTTENTSPAFEISGLGDVKARLTLDAPTIKENGVNLIDSYLAIADLEYNSSTAFAVAWEAVDRFSQWMRDEEDGTYELVSPTIAAGFVNAIVGQFNVVTAAQGNIDNLHARILTADSITTDLIAANAITATEIAANTITAVEIAANTITASQIAANTITAGQIAANAITTSELAANSVTSTNIVAGTIVASDIATNTITASQIAANAINTSELAANAVTATEINVSTLSAISANMGTITAGTITGALIQTSSSTSVDRTVIDSDTLRHFSANDSTPVLVIGKTYSGGVSGVILDVGHPTMNASAIRSSNSSGGGVFNTVISNQNASGGGVYVSVGVGGGSTAYALSVNNPGSAEAIYAYGGILAQGTGTKEGLTAVTTVASTRAALIQNINGIPLKLQSKSTSAPMEINSSVMVTNLNAQYVGGKQFSDFASLTRDDTAGTTSTQYSFVDKVTGFTIKCGRTSLMGGNASKTVSFYSAFSTICMAIAADDNNNAGEWTGGSVTSRSNTSITVLNHDNSSHNLDWIAMGYTAV